MEQVRFKSGMLLYKADGEVDLEFIRIASQHGLKFVQERTINAATGELSAAKGVFVTEDGERYATEYGQLLVCTDAMKSAIGKPYLYIWDNVYKNLFESLNPDEVSDLDSFKPEIAISDEQYKRMAVRCCIFMEHNVKDASTPVKAENVAGDKGGLTKYGICQASYPNLDIANLTYDDAVKIYERDYWPDAKADQLPRPLNALAFDLCVTSGPKNMMRVLQRAVGTTDDGIWGPKTKAAASSSCSTTPKMLAVTRLFTEKRIAYYQAIVKNNSSQAKFLNGWINRAVRSQNFAQALLHTLDVL